jgi:DNA invertase Pin-like site-specific DNA recombinase
MSVTKPRKRLVFFRVSEEEFQQLTTLCSSTNGARSISELARSAVSRLLTEQDPGDQPMMNQLRRLDQSVKEVQRTIEHLATILDGSASGEKPPVKRGGNPESPLEDQS